MARPDLRKGVDRSSTPRPFALLLDVPLTPAKHRVGLREKDPGRHWSEPAAPAVSPLRANDLNGHWHQLWNTLTPNT